METPSLVGYDLDHTLVEYKLSPKELLIYRAVFGYLVFEADIGLDPYAFLLEKEPRRDLMVKGSILDFHLGHQLLIRADRTVKTVYVNGRETSEDVIQELYPDPIRFEGKSNERFFSLTTHFERPLAAVFHEAIQICRKEPLMAGRLRELVEVAAAINTTEASFQNGFGNFAFQPSISVGYGGLLLLFREALFFNFHTWGNGNYYPSFQNDPTRFIHSSAHLSPLILKTKFVAPHMSHIIITNSVPEYVMLMLDTSFGERESWLGLFDLVLCKAAKPWFWSKHNRAAPEVAFPDDPDERIREKVFRGGCWRELRRILGKKAVQQMTYLGDHCFSDVMVPNAMDCGTVVAVGVEDQQDMRLADDDCFWATRWAQATEERSFIVGSVAEYLEMLLGGLAGRDGQ